MRTIPLSVALLALTAGVSSAQRVVFPRDHAGREGYSHEYHNHFSAGISRMQYLYEQWDLQIPTGKTITRFGFRQDGKSALVGKSIEFEVWMGKCKLDVEGLTTTFANNYDGPRLKVVNRKIFKLPDLSVPSQQPSTKFVWVPLDKQYVHDASRNLLVDIFVFANSNANKSFNYPLDKARYHSSISTVGKGCKTSANTHPQLTIEPAVIGTSWYVRLTKAPASTPWFFLLGDGKFPTPVPLPGGCFLYTNLTYGLWYAGATNTAGNGVLHLPIPFDLGLYAKTLTLQAIAVDVFANPLKLVFSNGTAATVGAAPRQALCYKYGPGSTTAKTGWVSRHVGLVTAFEYQ